MTAQPFRLHALSMMERFLTMNVEWYALDYADGSVLLLKKLYTLWMPFGKHQENKV